MRRHQKDEARGKKVNFWDYVRQGSQTTIHLQNILKELEQNPVLEQVEPDVPEEAEKEETSVDDIDNAMKMNFCRCGTYQRVRKAIHSASEEIKKG